MGKQADSTLQTRKNLINAFWKLYKNNDDSRITVGMICKLANYNRTTFYRYFLDIDDMLKQFEDEIIINLKDKVKNKTNDHANIYLDGFKRFNDNYGEYIVVFHEKGNRRFYNKFKQFIKDYVFDYLNLNINDQVKKEFIFEFMFSSHICTYAYWYRNSDIMSLESFIKFTNNVLFNGITTINNE